MRVPILVLSATLIALSQSPAPPPLSVTAAPDAPAQSRLKLTMTNTSSKKISAFVVLVRFETPDGHFVRAVEMEDLALLPGSSPLAPGGETAAFLEIPSQAGKELKISEAFVDYVAFYGGGTWGKDEEHLSLRIKGTRDGWARAYLRLNRTFKQQGKDAVADELERFNADRSSKPKSN
jgi:hypothetical protein